MVHVFVSCSDAGDGISPINRKSDIECLSKES